MSEDEFCRYVCIFNDRDYDALHEYFSDDVELLVNRISLKGRAGFDRFYNHFHQVIREEIKIVNSMTGQNCFCGAWSALFLQNYVKTFIEACHSCGAFRVSECLVFPSNRRTHKI